MLKEQELPVAVIDELNDAVFAALTRSAVVQHHFQQVQNTGLVIDGHVAFH